MAIKVNWPSQHWTYYSYDIILTWMLLNSLACKIAETTKRTLIFGMDVLAHMSMTLGQSPHQHWTRKHLSSQSHQKRNSCLRPFPEQTFSLHFLFLLSFLHIISSHRINVFVISELIQQVFIEFPLCCRYCPRFQWHSKNKICTMSCFCLSPHLREVTDEQSTIMFQKYNTC